MGQIEVFEWLQRQRASGNEEYFTVKEIHAGANCGCTKGNIYTAVIKLEADGYLEVERRGRWTDFRRVFRLKQKYVSHIQVMV